MYINFFIYVLKSIYIYSFTHMYIFTEGLPWAERAQGCGCWDRDVPGCRSRCSLVSPQPPGFLLQARGG